MLTFRAALALAALTGLGMAQTHVSFPTEDDKTVIADLYGQSTRGVVLAHGGRFKKEVGRSRRACWRRRDSPR